MNIIQQNIYIADETIRIFIFHRLLNHRLFYFIREMMGMRFRLSFCNALISLKAQRGKIKPIRFQIKKEAVSVTGNL
jgi:hypothetical protein